MAEFLLLLQSPASYNYQNRRSAPQTFVPLPTLQDWSGRLHVELNFLAHTDALPGQPQLMPGLEQTPAREARHLALFLACFCGNRAQCGCARMCGCGWIWPAFQVFLLERRLVSGAGRSVSAAPGTTRRLVSSLWFGKCPPGPERQQKDHRATDPGIPGRAWLVAKAQHPWREKEPEAQRHQ